jgi:hypothetical protein
MKNFDTSALPACGPCVEAAATTPGMGQSSSVPAKASRCSGCLSENAEDEESDTSLWFTLRSSSNAEA